MAYNPENQTYELPESDYHRLEQAAATLRELTLMLSEVAFYSNTVINGSRLAHLLQYPADALNDICSRLAE